MTKTKKSTLFVGAAALACVGAIALTAIPTTFASANVVNYKTNSTVGKWQTDFASYEEELEYAGEFNQEIYGESCVLLQNDNNALPLKEGSNITLLGTRSYNTITGGTGSGGASGDFITMQDSLEDAGIGVNNKVAQLYNKYTFQAAIQTGMGSGRSNTYVDGSIAETHLDGVVDSFRNYGDAAIITVGRVGGEGNDLIRDTEGTTLNKDSSKHVLQLFDDEIELIKFAKQNFNKVVVLLNTDNAMEVEALTDKSSELYVDAIMWIGEPGVTGLGALGKVLTGKINPSGRLTDIWDADHTKDPTWVNFGDNSQVDGTNAFSRVIGKDADGKDITYSGNAIEYEEDIYMGYKYYETACELGSINYDKAVTFAYGEGMSYTKFIAQFDSTFNLEEAVNKVENLDDEILVPVSVSNVGEVAGKYVVQLYNSNKYVNGQIEKASVSLAGFAKTDILEPGEDQLVRVHVRAGELANFDYNDANKNGFSGWEIESLENVLYLKDNSHDVIGSMAYQPQAIMFAEDGTAKRSVIHSRATAEVESYNKLSQGDDYDTLINKKEGSDMWLLSRATWNETGSKTFPTAMSENTFKTYSDRVIKLLTNQTKAAGTNDNESRYTSYYNSSDDKVTDPWYKTVNDIPDYWTQADDYDVSERTNGKTQVQLREMVGLDYTSDTQAHTPYGYMSQKKAWGLFMNQLSYKEMADVLRNGGYQTLALESVGKDKASDQDGPAQLGSGTYWCSEMNIAATWNVELANEQGVLVGNESLYQDIPGWYGPAMNTHRTAFSGRNFEYYSQDSVHGGWIAAYVVKGAQSKGCNCYIKHFGLNDQETDRTGTGTFASEQNIRENYFKDFEFAVKFGGATSVMTAFNRVGAINEFANYMTLQSIMRDEWGFKGAAVTDYYAPGNAKANYMQRGGCEIPLNNQYTAYDPARTGKNISVNAITGVWDDQARGGLGAVRDGNAAADGTIPISYTQWYAIRSCAERLLWVAANTNCNENCLNKDVAVDQEYAIGQGVSCTLNAGVDAAKFGSDDLTYTATGLPEGLTIDANTGVISGKCTDDVDTYAVKVTVVADGWSKTTYTVTIEVEEAFVVELPETVQAGEAVEGACSSEYIYINNDDNVSAIEYSAEGLPAGLEMDADGKISGTVAEDAENGVYVVKVTCTATQTTEGSSGMKTNKDVDYTTLVVITVEGGVDPEEDEDHGAIVNAVIVNNELIVTYEDGTVVNLGNVQGPAGKDGADGKDGKDGADGKDGKDGADGKDATSGCGSVIGATGAIAAVASLGALAAGAVVIRKKKND